MLHIDDLLDQDGPPIEEPKTAPSTPPESKRMEMGKLSIHSKAFKPSPKKKTAHGGAKATENLRVLPNKKHKKMEMEAILNPHTEIGALTEVLALDCEFVKADEIHVLA